MPASSGAEGAGDVPKIVLVPYQDSWPTRFQIVAAELADVFGHRARRIEHIGSTAIPAMTAKDVIDVQVSAPRLDDLDVLDTPLGALGYRRLPYIQDHVPAGRDDDPGLWQKRLWSRRGRGDDVNLHVRVIGSPNERLALLFRDWLRAHPRSVAAYGRFKELLATSVTSLDTYSDVKDPVVDVIAEAAERWADATGWTQGGDPQPFGGSERA